MYKRFVTQEQSHFQLNGIHTMQTWGNLPEWRDMVRFLVRLQLEGDLGGP